MYSLEIMLLNHTCIDLRVVSPAPEPSAIQGKINDIVKQKWLLYCMICTGVPLVTVINQKLSL